MSIAWWHRFSAPTGYKDRHRTGPRDRIPAPFAVKFAQAYYMAAQDTPDPGRAVLAARLACLTEFGNPLGCLYFAIGDVG